MKKRRVVLLLVLCLVLCGVLIYVRTCTFAFLPRGELVDSSVSPNGRWRAHEYYIDTGAGAMASDDGRVEVVDTGEHKPARTIYYGEPLGRPVRWKDANTVVVNGHVIDVRTGTYPPSPSAGEYLRSWLDVLLP